MEYLLLCLFLIDWSAISQEDDSGESSPVDQGCRRTDFLQFPLYSSRTKNLQTSYFDGAATLPPEDERAMVASARNAC
jgi:hypothetical protein